jgi:hypothetical protein
MSSNTACVTNRRHKASLFHGNEQWLFVDFTVINNGYSAADFLKSSSMLGLSSADSKHAHPLLFVMPMGAKCHSHGHDRTY